jgi:hypothetical protein
MVSSYTMMSEILTDLSTKLTSATTIGGISSVSYYPEHPAIPADRNQLPKAYVLPIVEGGGNWDTSPMPGLDAEFPITILAYYELPANSLLTLTQYALNFIDILYNAGQYIKQGQIDKMDLEFKQWGSGDTLIHMWILKLHIKVLYVNS